MRNLRRSDEEIKTMLRLFFSILLVLSHTFSLFLLEKEWVHWKPCPCSLLAPHRMSPVEDREKQKKRKNKNKKRKKKTPRLSSALTWFRCRCRISGAGMWSRSVTVVKYASFFEKSSDLASCSWRIWLNRYRAFSNKYIRQCLVANYVYPRLISSFNFIVASSRDVFLF